MEMERKKVGIVLWGDAHEQLKEIARSRRMTVSGLIQRWIEKTYSKYSEKKEESQDGENMDAHPCVGE